MVIDYIDRRRASSHDRPNGCARIATTNGAAAPLDAPGAQDITADVVLEQLVAASPFVPDVVATTQADWLRDLGIDELVEEGRRAWDDGAHVGDLAALAGRSRVNEAAALTDPAGLGAHRVLRSRRLRAG